MTSSVRQVPGGRSSNGILVTGTFNGASSECRFGQNFSTCSAIRFLLTSRPHASQVMYSGCKGADGIALGSVLSSCAVGRVIVRGATIGIRGSWDGSFGFFYLATNGPRDRGVDWMCFFDFRFLRFATPPQTRS